MKQHPAKKRLQSALITTLQKNKKTSVKAVFYALSLTRIKALKAPVADCILCLQENKNARHQSAHFPS